MNTVLCSSGKDTQVEERCRKMPQEGSYLSVSLRWIVFTSMVKADVLCVFDTP